MRVYPLEATTWMSRLPLVAERNASLSKTPTQTIEKWPATWKNELGVRTSKAVCPFYSLFTRLIDQTTGDYAICGGDGRYGVTPASFFALDKALRLVALSSSRGTLDAHALACVLAREMPLSSPVPPAHPFRFQDDAESKKPSRQVYERVLIAHGGSLDALQEKQREARDVATLMLAGFEVLQLGLTESRTWTLGVKYVV